MTYSALFNRAWDDMKNNLAFVAGLSAVVMLITWTLSLIPFLGYIFSSLVSVGYINCLYQIKKGKIISYGDLFWGFTDINRLIQILIMSTVIVFIMTIGFFLLIAPGVWWMVATWLASTIFVLKTPDAVEAIKSSLKIVKDRWWYFFGLGTLVILMNIGGAMCFFIGLFVSVPMTALVCIEAVEQFYTGTAIDNSNLSPEPPALA